MIGRRVMIATIQRSIARDIVITFLVSLLALTTLVMGIGVAREAMSQGLGLTAVIRLVPYATPNALALAVPGTALFSVCCVYGRMSVDNEFTAMQSVGISPLPAILPAIAITILLSLATVGLINTAFTWGFHGIQRVVMSSIERVAYDVLQRERTFQHGPMMLTVSDVKGRDLIEPTIKLLRPDDESVVITARNAVMSYSDADESLTFRVTDGNATIGNTASFRFPDTFVHTISLRSDRPGDLLSANPSHMPMRKLPLAKTQQRDDIDTREREIAVQAAFGVLTSRHRSVGGGAAQTRSNSLVQSRRRLHRLDAEMHRRWASGFTCLALALVGIPLAIRMKSSDTMTIFGTVFLPTLLIYYPIFALTLDMAKDGRIAAAGVWIANGLFVTLSFVMMRRIIYSPC